MAKISYGIVETEAEIANLMMNALAEQITPVFIAAQPEILNGIQEDILLGLQSTTEYALLTTGRWRAHFGFEKGSERLRLDTIISVIANSTKIECEPFKYNSGRFTGGITLRMLVEDYSDILPLKQSIVENRVNIPVDLPWLDWFLTSGGMTPGLVSGYHIVFGSEGDPRNRRSRSGIAIMSPGGSWVVPGDGSHNDNWLTRFFISQDFLDRMSIRVYKAIKG